MKLIETRGNDGIKPTVVDFSQAILSPSASFGGLYAPQDFPAFEADFFTKATTLSYQALTLEILKRFAVDIPVSVLEEALGLYGAFDDPNNPAPLTKLDENLFVSELYHGPTRAFKDMALQPFGHILSHLAKERNENYVILAATSGDTGPATLDTFSDKPNIRVVCLYPQGGTSDVQRLQMVTAPGQNLSVLGIKGNFDDAQRALKHLLTSPSFLEHLAHTNLKLSAANSVNFGRIIFQIVYHIFAYVQLLKQGHISAGESVYLTIPSGNFGNALGAFYAKKMGLPVEKILIASNINNILTELFTTGVYDVRDRALLQTTSPAMDILVSSNVERLLFACFGSAHTRELMEALQTQHVYTLTAQELAFLQEHFGATYCDDAFAKETMRAYALKGYILDPHTATCLKATSLVTKPLKNILCSTAEWTKFAPTLFSALQQSPRTHPDKVALEGVSNALHVRIPRSIGDLFSAPVLHPNVVDQEAIESTIIALLSKELA
ncbi:MAG: threonine synthase [Campylobacterales bacterium]|nr:threonine synthase [Campylobacterales bacterium]